MNAYANARQFKDYADALHNDALRRQQYSTDMAYSLSGGSSSSSSSYQSETIDPRLLYNEPDMPPSKFYGSRDVASFPQVPMSMGVLRLPLEDRPSKPTSTNPKKLSVQCLYPKCDANPFGRKTDLKRHYGSVHANAHFDCLYASSMPGECTRMGARGFKRHDHYVEHLRDVHRVNIPKKSRRSSQMESSRDPPHDRAY